MEFILGGAILGLCLQFGDSVVRQEAGLSGFGAMGFGVPISSRNVLWAEPRGRNLGRVRIICEYGSHGFPVVLSILVVDTFLVKLSRLRKFVRARPAVFLPMSLIVPGAMRTALSSVSSW
jgi:hypothetical protein